MPTCKKCQSHFPNHIKIDGKDKNLSNRKYCLDCSPFGSHNTKKLETGKIKQIIENNEIKRKCIKCNEYKCVNHFHEIKGKRKYYSYCKICLYEIQKNRWLDRKMEAIKLMGGKCVICGYCKNYAAMEFHHLDPSVKEMTWVKAREMKWNKTIEELKKCVLLCANCHRETHNPDASLIQTREANPLLTNTLKPTGKCPNCQTDVYNTKHCSVQCAAASKRKVDRPTRDELKKLLEKHNFSQLGIMFGVTDSSIRKWVKFYDLK